MCGCGDGALHIGLAGPGRADHGGDPPVVTGGEPQCGGFFRRQVHLLGDGAQHVRRCRGGAAPGAVGDDFLLRGQHRAGGQGQVAMAGVDRFMVGDSLQAGPPLHESRRVEYPQATDALGDDPLGEPLNARPVLAEAVGGVDVQVPADGCFEVFMVEHGPLGAQFVHGPLHREARVQAHCGVDDLVAAGLGDTELGRGDAQVCLGHRAAVPGDAVGASQHPGGQPAGLVHALACQHPLDLDDGAEPVLCVFAMPPAARLTGGFRPGLRCPGP